MKKDQILFVNACVRAQSRTRWLAERVLEALGGEMTEVKLFLDPEALEPDAFEAHKAPGIEAIQSEAFLAARDEAVRRRDFSDDVYKPARQFASADIIVIAAPYWDLSFPAVLKAYFEQINVLGLTFAYTEEGRPKGLCRARKLLYVTTAGGPILSDEFGYGYIKTLAQVFYGIQDVCQIKAEGLDIVGADVEAILKEAAEAWLSA